jgi:hypothetical protein
MRIEGHGGRRAPAFARAPPHPIDDLHVAAVQAIEVPEGEHRLVPPRRRIVREVGDVHVGFRTSAFCQAPGCCGTARPA